MYGSRIYNGCLFFIATLLISLKYGGKSGKIAPQLASANCGVYNTENIDMGKEIKPSGVPEECCKRYMPAPRKAGGVFVETMSPVVVRRFKEKSIEMDADRQESCLGRAVYLLDKYKKGAAWESRTLNLRFPGGRMMNRSPALQSKSGATLM